MPLRKQCKHILKVLHLQHNMPMQTHPFATPPQFTCQRVVSSDMFL